MRLVVDFDVSRSFVLQGNPETPAGVRGVIFTPTIRVEADLVIARLGRHGEHAVEDNEVEVGVDVEGRVHAREEDGPADARGGGRRRARFGRQAG
jgi:hypothetical protein